VVQGPGQPRLAQEAVRELGGVRVEAAQLLERDLTIQVRLPGGVYDRHAAATDLAQDLIATDRAHASKVRRAGAADNR
jgi:hypothetical protein